MVFADGPKANNTQGNLFEEFIGRLLVIEGYDIESNLRSTGAEFDIVGTEKNSRATCCVECKSSFQAGNKAGDISKLLGNAIIGEFRQARFYSAAELSGGSKGLAYKNRQGELDTKGIEFSIYGPKETIERSIETRILSDPKVAARKNFKSGIGDKATLFISPKGAYWGFHLKHRESEVCFLTSADFNSSQEIVTDESLLEYHDQHARHPGDPFTKAMDFLEFLESGVVFQPNLAHAKDLDEVARQIVQEVVGELKPNFETLVSATSKQVSYLQDDFRRIARQQDSSDEVKALADRAWDDFVDGEVSKALEGIQIAESVSVGTKLRDDVMSDVSAYRTNLGV